MLVVGLMSGRSADAIDAVLADIAEIDRHHHCGRFSRGRCGRISGGALRCGVDGQLAAAGTVSSTLLENWLTIHRRPANVPACTGAKGARILGKIVANPRLFF